MQFRTKSKPKRRISNSLLEDSNKKVNSFLRKEKKLSAEIEAIKADIEELNNQRASFSVYDIKMKENKLKLAEVKLNRIMKDRKDVELRFDAFTERNNSINKY